LLRRAIALDAKNFPANYDLGRLLVKLKRYDEALPVLERAAVMGKDDPGIHYQLFTAYSRLKRREDAERELSIFKRLEEARKKGSGTSSSESSGDGNPPLLPPPADLPEPATERNMPKTP
jgi:tetratricopeptide (TPR) repeat protein